MEKVFAAMSNVIIARSACVGCSARARWGGAHQRATKEGSGVALPQRRWAVSSGAAARLCRLSRPRLAMAHSSSASAEQDLGALKSIGLYEACEEEPIFRQLRQDGVSAGDACPLEILNKYDNMNYFGADGSREMLATICEWLGTSDVPVRVVDIGAGFGGTSRVMVSELEQLGYVGSSAAALELQPAVSKTGGALTQMCELAGELKPGAVTHAVADAVSGSCEPATATPVDGEADVVVSSELATR